MLEKYKPQDQTHNNNSEIGSYLWSKFNGGNDGSQRRVMGSGGFCKYQDKDKIVIASNQ